MRLCQNCKEFSIPFTKPSWVSICSACYVHGQTHLRECSACRMPAINGSDPKWKKICGACYKAQKSTK